MSQESTKYRRELRRIFAKHFDMADLRVLSFDLGVNWDELRGETQREKVQAFIHYLGMRGQLRELIELAKEERMDIVWPEIPGSDEQIRDEKANIPESEREAALQKYLTDMERFVERKNHNSASIATVQAYTDSVWHSLDFRRRAIVIKLLFDSQLLSKITHAERDLRRANLKGKNFGEADLMKADLREADLREADLHGTDLSNANLQRANLRKADLHGTDLSNANLQWANLSQAKLTEANLSKADLNGADLNGVDLSNANLQWANLREANLEWAKLDGSKLGFAKLNGAVLFGANLSNAELGSLHSIGSASRLFSTTKKLGNYVIAPRINLEGAKYDEETQWPKGFDPAEFDMVYIEEDVIAGEFSEEYEDDEE